MNFFKSLLITFLFIFSLVSVNASINNSVIFLDFENPSNISQNNGSVSTTWSIGNQTHDSTNPIFGNFSMNTDDVNEEWSTTDVSFGNSASDSFTVCYWFRHNVLMPDTWVAVQGLDAGNDNWDTRYINGTATYSINARTSTGTGTHVQNADDDLHSICNVLDNVDDVFELWLDGVNVANGTFSAYDPIDELYLFNDKNGDQQGDVVIDLIGIWDYAFTPDNVSEYYNSGVPFNPYFQNHN